MPVVPAQVEEGTPPPSAELRAEPAALKPRALQKRAEAIGVDEDALEEPVNHTL